MEKLKLNLDDLQVESFDTTPQEQAEKRGTVIGYVPDTEAPTCYYTCDDFTCPVTCGGTTCTCWAPPCPE